MHYTLKYALHTIPQNDSDTGLAADGPDIIVQWTWSIAHSFYT